MYCKFFLSIAKIQKKNKDKVGIYKVSKIMVLVWLFHCVQSDCVFSDLGFEARVVHLRPGWSPIGCDPNLPRKQPQCDTSRGDNKSRESSQHFLCSRCFRLPGRCQDYRVHKTSDRSDDP